MLILRSRYLGQISEMFRWLISLVRSYSTLFDVFVRPTGIVGEEWEEFVEGMSSQMYRSPVLT